MDDADLLFAWANDPVARAHSRKSDPISREDHDAWMKMNVEQGYPAHLVLIAETDEGSAGVVRFDVDKRDVMTYVVSINVAPSFRGKKLSHAILAEACRMMQESTLRAVIKPDNVASRRIFEKCGFTLYATDGSYLTYRRKPVQ